MSPARRPAADAPPEPPVPPELEECCGSGCDRCIFDIYQQALERYEAACRAWEARRAEAVPATGRKGRAKRFI